MVLALVVVVVAAAAVVGGVVLGAAVVVAVGLRWIASFCSLLRHWCMASIRSSHCCLTPWNSGYIYTVVSWQTCFLYQVARMDGRRRDGGGGATNGVIDTSYVIEACTIRVREDASRIIGDAGHVLMSCLLLSE